MIIIDREDMNSNYELCKKCGGKCCKKHACDSSPEDFDCSIEKMRLALESGNYSIDFSRSGDTSSFVFEGNKLFLDTDRVKASPHQFFYIRPRNVGRPIVDFIHTEADEGPCIFWNKDTGCPLEYNKKPKGGRTLVPFPGGPCIAQYNKIFMMQEWRPFTSELISLAKEFFDEMWCFYRDLNFYLK